jgi:hypothetical protein
MKYIFLVLLLLISPFLYSDIKGDISISKTLKDNTAKAEIFLAYSFDIKQLSLIPYTKYTNFFYITNVFSNKPFRDIFETGLQIEYGNIYIRINHICDHPVSYKNNYRNNEWIPFLDYGVAPTGSANYITIGYKWGHD